MWLKRNKNLFLEPSPSRQSMKININLLVTAAEEEFNIEINNKLWTNNNIITLLWLAHLLRSRYYCYSFSWTVTILFCCVYFCYICDNCSISQVCWYSPVEHTLAAHARVYKVIISHFQLNICEYWWHDKREEHDIAGTTFIIIIM